MYLDLNNQEDIVYLVDVCVAQIPRTNSLRSSALRSPCCIIRQAVCVKHMVLFTNIHTRRAAQINAAERVIMIDTSAISHSRLSVYKFHLSCNSYIVLQTRGLTLMGTEE